MSRYLDELFDPLPTHLNVEQLAKVLGIKVSTAYRWLKTGSVPGYKTEGHWLIIRDEVKDWVASHRPDAGGGDGAA